MKFRKILSFIVFLIFLYSNRTRANEVIIESPDTFPPVCPCEYEFEPVCGNDGVTYLNKCILECINNFNSYKGIAPIDAYSQYCQRCNCQPVDFPVCTMDGETYPNECELGCENMKRIQQNQSLIYLAYRTACLGSSCGCTTVATSPVCGTDNVLYRNFCVLNCASANAESQGLPKIYTRNVGACMEGCLCPIQKEPVCGSDGKIYDNICLLECQNINSLRYNIKSSNSHLIKVADMKLCTECLCSSEIELVCGSDNKTYSSACDLNCEARRLNNPYLKVESYGACRRCVCVDLNDPVCGTDGVTYRNECELKCANEELIIEQQPIIRIYKHGPCQNNQNKKKDKLYYIYYY